MNYVTIGLVVIICLAIIYYIGHRKRTSHLDMIKRTAASMIREHQADFFGIITYHGGLPELPKPCFLYLGLGKDAIVFYTGENFAAKVPFASCANMEKFSVKAKAGNFMKSTVILGPLVPYLFKDKIRYFVSVEYKDSNHEENNILFETAKSEQKGLHEALLKHRVKSAG